MIKNYKKTEISDNNRSEMTDKEFEPGTKNIKNMEKDKLFDYDRDVLIKAIKQFDESFVGESMDDYTYDRLIKTLDEIASNTDFTLDELVESLGEGF